MAFDKEQVKQLILSAATGDAARVRFLIGQRRMPVDATLPGKPSALCYAAMNGDHRLADYLLAEGADANFTDVNGQTPLIYATLGSHTAILIRLIESGADPCRENIKGQTALMLARKINERPCVEALIIEPPMAYRLH